MKGITITYKVDLSRRGAAERTATPRVKKPEPAPGADQATLGAPIYCARLLALAYYLDRRLADGSIRNFNHAAEVLGVSHTRASQILGLLNLKPEIQEAVLGGDCTTTERGLRDVAICAAWSEQVPTLVRY